MTLSRWWVVIALVLMWSFSLAAHSWTASILLDAVIFIASTYCIHYFFGFVWSGLAMICGTAVSLWSYLFYMHEMDNHLDVPKLLFVCSYIMIGMIGALLIEWMRRMQYKAELIELVSKSRYDMFLRLDNAYQKGISLQNSVQELLQYIAEHQQNIVMIKSMNHAQEVQSLPPISLLTILDSRSEKDPLKMVHHDDLNRIASEQQLLNSRINVNEQEQSFRTQDCVCRKFSTYLGDFFVWHLIH